MEMYDEFVEMSCGQGDNIFVSEDEVQEYQLNGYWVVSYPRWEDTDGRSDSDI